MNIFTAFFRDREKYLKEQELQVKILKDRREERDRRIAERIRNGQNVDSTVYTYDRNNMSLLNPQYDASPSSSCPSSSYDSSSCSSSSSSSSYE